MSPAVPMLPLSTTAAEEEFLRAIRGNPPSVLHRKKAPERTILRAFWGDRLGVADLLGLRGFGESRSLFNQSHIAPKRSKFRWRSSGARYQATGVSFLTKPRGYG